MFLWWFGFDLLEFVCFRACLGLSGLFAECCVLIVLLYFYYLLIKIVALGCGLWCGSGVWLVGGFVAFAGLAGLLIAWLLIVGGLLVWRGVFDLVLIVVCVLDYY